MSNSRTAWPYVIWFWLSVPVLTVIKLMREPLGVDEAWYLYVGQQMLAGKRLYQDILETNPPLICFISIIPNWISNVLHANVKLVWLSFAALLITAPIALSTYLLANSRRLSQWQLALTGFVFATVCFIAFLSGFGERDHFAFVASLPLICLSALRVTQNKVSLVAVLLTSVWTGIFLALKPFFLVPGTLCLLYVLIQGRSFRLPELYIIPAITILHLMVIVTLTPAYFTVARLASQWYGGYDRSWQMITVSLGLPLAGIAISAVYRSSDHYKQWIRLTGLATLGWILSAILQHKGFHYHLRPAFAGSTILGWFVLLDIWSRDFWQRISRVFVAATGVVVFICLSIYDFQTLRRFHLRHSYGSEVLLPALRSVGHTRVLFISTSLIGFPDVNETHVQPEGTYACFWTLPGLYYSDTRRLSRETPLRFHDLQTMPWAEHEIFDSTYRALDTKPTLIVVDARKHKQGMGNAVFDFESYFQRDERIQKLWSGYHERPAVRDFRIYERN